MLVLSENRADRCWGSEFRVNRLRSGASIETQQSTESLKALDWSDRRFVAAIRLDQSVVEPLVIPLRVVMSGELSGRLPK